MAKKPNIICSICNTPYYTKPAFKNQTNPRCGNCRTLAGIKTIRNCINCGKETKNPKFCSKSCSASINNVLTPKRATKRKCIICEEKVMSYRHSRCKIHHQEYINNKTEIIQNYTLEHYWSKKSLQNLHISSKNAHIRILCRSTYKDLVKLPCANCGYNKHVELCHIKPVRDFLPTATIAEVNARSNIIQLCRNCHWEFDKGLLTLEFPEQLESQ